jgi:hypothetical protein
MKGRWECRGAACTPNHIKDELKKNDDGSFSWIDGNGRIGKAEVREDLPGFEHILMFVVTWPDNTQTSGAIRRRGCNGIGWGPNHEDVKID